MNEYERQLEEAETQANEYMHSDSESDERDLEAQSTKATQSNLSQHPTHVHRWQSQIIQHTHTVARDARRSKTIESRPLPEFGAGKVYPPEPLAEREAYVVDFSGPDDPLHPQNWPTREKRVNFILGVVSCLTSSFASSCLSEATGQISTHFGVSLEVGSLLSALYLCGYGVGPSLWAPLSELQGRKLPLVLGNFGFAVFAVGVAVAKDVQTLMICRFFMGVFGSSPLVIVAAMFTDMFDAERRGPALVIFCGSVFMGPMLGPIVGSFTVESYLGWRWCSYWSMIMGFTATALLILFLKETYPPAILVTKAEYLRRRTKNWAIHAKQEEVEIDLKELVTKNVSRPLRMLFEEPILLLIGFYITFAYTLLYISITAFPEVYEGVHHWRPGVASLPFIGMMIGISLAAAGTIAVNPIWVRKFHANGNQVVPEWRLPFSAVSGIVFAIGLFWFGWTGNYRSVHWIVPTIGGSFIGFGIVGLFIGLVSYIMDAYLMFAASALGGNTVLRSVVAGSAPLYDRQLFNNLGVEWGMTLLGCLAVLLIPVPILFIKYGAKLREKSTWAPYTPATLPVGDSETDTLAENDRPDPEKEVGDTQS